jgi:transposase
MKPYAHYIGIDISKDALDVAIWKGDKPICQVFSNSKAGLQTLIKWMRDNKLEPSATLFCCENTGLYTRALTAFCLINQWTLWVEHPDQIRLSKGMTRGKSDAIDAADIAEYAWRFQDKAQLYCPEDEHFQALGDLVALRRRLLQCLQALQVPVNEIEKTNPKQAKLLRGLSKSSRAAIEKDLDKVDAQIQELIDADPNLKPRADLIRSVPGAGPVLTAYLLYVTKGFTRLTDPRKLACYAGIAPFPHQSGSSIRGKERVSHKANKRLKTLLHMSAVSLTQHKEFKTWYKAKKELKKPSMSILNALKNKLIHRICAVVARGTPYLPPAEFSKAKENSVAAA